MDRGKISRTLTVSVAAVALVCVCAWGQPAGVPADGPEFGDADGYEVVRVPAGDRVVIEVGEGEVTVRLTGVSVAGPGDTPDQALVRIAGAKTFLSDLLLGEKVHATRDSRTPTTDEDGARPAYLYRLPGGLFVNHEIVRQGYARAETGEPLKYAALLVQAEKEAREAGRGLWAEDAKAGGDAARGTGGLWDVITTRDGRVMHVNVTEVRGGKVYFTVTVVMESGVGKAEQSLELDQVERIEMNATEHAVKKIEPPSVRLPVADTDSISSWGRRAPRVAGTAESVRTAVRRAPRATEREVRETVYGQADPNTTVYITGGQVGDYHERNCRQLRGRSFATKLSWVRSRGYTPCRECSPPR